MNCHELYEAYIILTSRVSRSRSGVVNTSVAFASSLLDDDLLLHPADDSSHLFGYRCTEYLRTIQTASSAIANPQR